MLDLDEESLSDRMQAGRNTVVFGLPCKKLQSLYRMQSVFFLMVWFIFWGLQYILKHFLLFLYVVSIRVAWEDPSVIRKWCVYSTQSQNHTVISKHSKDLFLSPCVCVCVCVPCMQVFAWLFLIFAGYVFWRWHLE